ncbi:MAG TPA: patatin-like phospholipase family protein [Tahibacter sp.]|nr:patatin-like phospholipase family protein [Tahibacter sp.]
MPNPTFEIGLVGAGAISAGAYTAGVVDFLVQALDAWYAAKDRGDAGVPTHDVKLRVFSGASAGGIAAALATSYLGTDQPPVTTLAQGNANDGKNRLFDSWVDAIDISRLLQTDDLQQQNGDVVSLLDGSVLQTIADRNLVAPPRTAPRRYVDENFHVFLTLTNLRGVPYSFTVSSGGTTTQYTMLLHGDYDRFVVSTAPQPAQPDRFSLTWGDFTAGSKTLDRLKLAALATSAFPIGLPPRDLHHTIPATPPDYYSERILGSNGAFVVPDWGNAVRPFRYDFRCVDGGVIDNEPFELARRVLSGGAALRNPPQGDKATRAVLLIDPFPNTDPFEPKYEAPNNLFKLAFSLVNALKNQSRFKPEELQLAADPDYYSRFMIAPKRDASKHPIACGSLGGFGGFLKRDFRVHDYFLGRRNAQQFLRSHFALYENNPLFDGMSADLREHYCVRDDTGNVEMRDGQRLLPIVPLVGDALVECFPPDWPNYDARDLARLEKQLRKRVGVLMDRLTHDFFSNKWPPVRWIARWVLGRKLDDVVEWAIGTVRADLTRHDGLMKSA